MELSNYYFIFVRQKSHEMAQSKWVLGHRVQLEETSGDYDLALGQTPPHTQGPPPHKHSMYNEVFVVTQGEMDFMINGEIRKVRSGESVDIPRGTVHTFSNNSDEECCWVNVHSPKGFRQFFENTGVSEHEDNAQLKSVDQDIINTVIRDAAKYDMELML